MKRFLPVALIVALAGAAVAVVVISGGDEEETKQPSVEQGPAILPDDLPPGLRELLRPDLDRVRSLECAAGRQALVELRPPLVPPRHVRTERAGEPPQLPVPPREIARGIIARAVRGNRLICQIELRGGGITVAARIGATWVQTVP